MRSFARSAHGRIEYGAGGACVDVLAPIGTVVLAFGPDPARETVLAHVAAARSAGNTVAILLTEPVAPAVRELCNGIEQDAGSRGVRWLEENDDLWRLPAESCAVAVVTDDTLAVVGRVLSVDGRRAVGDPALIDAYSRCTTYTVPIEVVAAAPIGASR
ncbi:hypothetical protein GSU68_09020 [Rathayibacter sp. VKM Ac-2759]|uniref:hypothetical protein n=1 Tax=Rathayibacter sp. VKM Ac-2759 TaxID=2609252 RepID=UPI001318BB71|nr:hypothetical protein [Rathayibacter sp. VKM Ac-2759]QHC66696.1 hypothetical protein GSU68_09020 [Rathayibacter sp. VKM Ac-2759]